jgi:outer membrane receptor protein involved in Fe transport
VNVPAAERIEVLKGPATALYGSDAIGGVVNVETRAPAAHDGVEAYAEAGAYGWDRVLGSVSARRSGDALRADLNYTRTDGWRTGTAYDRQTGSLRWDHLWSGASLKTVATFSRIDQQTAGSSTLGEDDYRDHPTLNYTPISFRNVRAFRLSTAYERTGGSTLLSVTPFVRWNEMELLPNWSLSYDPTVYTTGHRSAGVIARYRVDLAPVRTRLIAGVDVDYSPGFREEDRITPTRSGDGNRFYTDYTVAARVYDYDVTFHGISPYLQAEAELHPRVHLTAGVRQDWLGYDYDTHQASVDTVRYRVLDDTSLSYHHLSPKLGMTWEAGRALNLFASYTHGFRAPSEGQIFRPGRSRDTDRLAPVKADNYEAGARGQLGARIGYTVSAYRMEVSDDILTFQNADNSRETVNAGRTRHEGIELGLGAELPAGFRADVSVSRARHTYRDWSVRAAGGSGAAVDYSGHEMEAAPRDLWSARLAYSPTWLAGARVAADYQHVGRYWLDPDNTVRYGGHDLVSLTAGVPVGRALEATLRINNLTGEHYADGTAFNAATRTGEYAPGMPTTIYAGLQLRLGR